MEKRTMTDEISLERLGAEIRNIYRNSGEYSAEEIEKYLRAALGAYPPEERVALLHRLINCFARGDNQTQAGDILRHEDFDRLITMVLGREILNSNLSRQEMIDQLAAALNTVFDSVNKVVSGMNATLAGGYAGDETIRVLIGASLDRDEGIQALEKFLDQIGVFFATALEAFKKAVESEIEVVLGELDPERLSNGDGMGMKFGPMRKAHLYDGFCEKYRKLREWQRTGVLLQAFTREFEKNCQALYSRYRSADAGRQPG